jgi:DNA-binding NtrC family response regulator
MMSMPTQDKRKPLVLNIIELGGYPDFSRLFESLGYTSISMQSMRKALKYIKNNAIDLIVAEFNFQSDFRDRTSQLESLMASIAQRPKTRVIVFYDREQIAQFERLLGQFSIHASLAYPIDEDDLADAARSAQIAESG